ncbi:uncharacterized protein FOMMEDRAFT_141075 [Fomitiporia mediterranea MF3/22]|uniref:uncharacterized protein n=1 Tax=Fomitiporia mediterranea (strain MF3/22) TaxID=694068 RepID=UPI0004408CFD|nr:uncharacterized protein FOMMEDRAFT_141075 [Fomitiporia mediterranea MF3/22]EJD01821.1 hypothetical protein FOMMEDRAFT_141075 [Fomitiporia mediterranea MF3/22]
MALQCIDSFVPSYFASLPTELLIKIILELDWRSVLRLQLVNVELNEVIKTHTVVQYHVELGIAGMDDGSPFPHARFTTDERLARLRLYQSRWKYFSHAREQTVRKVNGAIWELASGVLAQGIRTGFNEVTGAQETRKLLFTRLPSNARVDSKMREWTHEGYDFSIRDFTIDPKQDLLVLLRAENENMGLAELHIRSLWTNENHPAARLAVLVHKLYGGTRAKSHSLQICHDRFAVLHNAVAGNAPEKLVVYNWKKGELIFEIEFCGIMSFAFLSSGHLLFAVQPFNVMPACHGDHQPRLLICDIDQTAALHKNGRPGSYIAICELHLPEMKQYADVVDTIIRAEPASDPFSDHASDDYPSLLPAPAFSVAPHNRLFVITLRVETVFDDIGDHRASETQTLGLFVPLSTFLPFMRVADTNLEPEIIRANSDNEDIYFGDFQARPPRRIAVGWESWMQYGARAMLVPGAESIYVCNVFGSRGVQALEPKDAIAPFAPRHVAVFDFNADAIRYDRALNGCEENRKGERVSDGPLLGPRGTVHDYLEPSTLQASHCGIFENDVATSLPYRKTILREKVRCDGVMLTEDNVIFVNKRAPKQYEVLTF